MITTYKDKTRANYTTNMASITSKLNCSIELSTNRIDNKFKT